MRIVLSLNCLLLLHVLFAQIKVVDSGLKPIAGVQLFGENRYLGVSNEEGVISVDTSSTKTNSWMLSHTNFHTKTFTKSELRMSTTFILNNKINSFSTVIITPRRGKRLSTDIAVQVDAISPKDIALFQPLTSADMLTINQKVYVQKSQQGGGSPMIRGFATNRILLVVDGVRMNTAIFRAGNVQNVLNIDPFSIASSEVIFGPASQFYGSDAIGGVLNFSTKNREFSDSITQGGNVTARYASASNAGTWHADYGFSNPRMSSLTSVSFSSFGDLKMGSKGPVEYLRPDYVVHRPNQGDTLITNDDPEVQQNSGYRQLNLMQKFAYKLSKYETLKYGLHWSSTSDNPRYDRLLLRDSNGLTNGNWYYGPQQWLMNNVSYENIKKTNWSDRIKIIAAHQFFEESRNDRKFGQNELRQRTENLTAFSTNIDIQKRLKNRLELSYGLEYIHNGLQSSGTILDISSGTTTATSTRYPDGATWNSEGLYLNLLKKWNTRHITEGGIRLNRVSTKGTFDTSFYQLPVNSYKNTNKAVTGSVSHIFKLNKGFVGALLSTAFKSPNIDDISKVFDSNPGFVTVPNPNLKPEYAYNTEINGEYLLTSKIKVNASFFFTYLTNALTTVEATLNGADSLLYDNKLSRVQTLQNQDFASVYGVQMSLLCEIAQALKLESTYTLLQSNASDGEPIRHITPNFGGSSLIYSMRKSQLVAYAHYNQEFSNAQFTINEREDKHLYATDSRGLPFSPRWATFNVRFVYPITASIVANVAAENIMDKRYRPYGSGITAPGRNIILSIKAQL